MSVKFVIGRSGSGKTRHCFEAIREALIADPLGPPLYWILPRQATFDAERSLTLESGLGGFCRARVLSFERLGREIFADCGGSAVPEVSGLGRQMILGHLLRQLKPDLRFYKGVARQVGLAAQLDVIFAELERNGKDANDLRATLRDIEVDQGTHPAQITPLQDKLHDLHLIYDRYSRFLGQSRLDQHQRALQVQELLGQCKLVREANFFVDGFLGFTSPERKLLTGIAGVASSMTITLTLDPSSRLLIDPNLLPDEFGPFFRTELTYRRLYFGFHEQNIEILEPTKLTQTPRFISPAIAHVEKHFFSSAPAAFEDPGHSAVVERFETSDLRGEVDAVARRIRALVSDGSGMRLRDIIVLARNLDSYHAMITASFAEHDIDWFADRRRNGSHHPLLRVVRSLFQIVRYNWRQDAVITLIRSGLVGITDYDADALENYLASHHLRGAEAWESAEPWEFIKRIRIDEDEADAAGESISADGAGTNALDARIDMDALRRGLVDHLKPMLVLLRSEETLTVRQIAVAVYQTLDALGAPPALARWIVQAREASELEEAGEHEQVWAGLSELFQQLVELLGDEPVELADFVDVLESGLEQFDLALTPPMVDQVLVGQVDRTRSPQVRVAFVLGLNEGNFPATLSDSSILTDRERRTLRDRSLELDPDLRSRAMDERLLGYIAFTRASERLILTRAAADAGGKAVDPSIFWRNISTLLPESQVVAVAGGSGTEIQNVATPRQLTTALMCWVRKGALTEPSTEDDPGPIVSPWPSLYQWLAMLPCDDGPIDRMRRKAWPALSYHNDATLDSKIGAALFTRDMVASGPQIEAFATCPFKHFARYGLSLKPTSRGELRPADLSQLYHRVLDRVMREAIRNENNASPETINQAMIQACTMEVSDTLRRALRLGPSRTAYLLERTERILGRFIESQRALSARGQFRPAHTGVQFGANARMGSVAIQTPGGARVSLHGSVDRVDLLSVEDSDSDAPVPAVVIDYRQGSRTLSLDEVYHGLSLQLLIGLLAVRDEGVALAGRRLKPVAAFVHPMLRRFKEVDRPELEIDTTEDDALLAYKPRGLFSADQLPRFDRDVLQTGGWSKVVQAFLTKAGTLGNKRSSDALEPEELSALLSHVVLRIGHIVDRMLSGEVSVAPYLLGNRSPCSHCDFRDVCRFQTPTNHYRRLVQLGREGVIERVLSADAGSADGK